MTEIFKTKSTLSSDFMTDIFKDRSVSHDHRKDLIHFYLLSKHLRIETGNFIGNKLWQILPSSLKGIPNL